MLLWGIIISLIVFTFSASLINLMVPGFSIAEKEQATLIFRVLLPYLSVQIISSFFVTVLNAEEKFGRAELLGITNTLISIASLVLLFPYMNVWALVISLLLGKTIEFIFYVNQLYKIDFRFRFILATPQFNHSIFFKAMQNTFLYVGATQIYNIILTSSISFLPVGTYAIFKFVQNLTNKIYGLFVQPFLIIFFTRYSLLLQEFKSVTTVFKTNMQSIINMNTIIIIGSILLGDYAINFLWSGEKFNDVFVKLAYVFLLCNLVGGLFSSVGSVYRKMAVAQSLGGKLYYFWTASQLLSAIFAYLLISNFEILGLLFVVPVNLLLMALASFIVYKKTINPLKFALKTYRIIFIIGLVTSAIVTKLAVSSDRIFENAYFKLTILILVSGILILNLVLKTYQLVIHESDSIEQHS